MPETISADDWIRHATRKWVFLLTGGVLLAGLAVTALAILSPRQESDASRDARRATAAFILGLDYHALNTEAGFTAYILLARRNGDSLRVDPEFFRKHTTYTGEQMGKLVYGLRTGHFSYEVDLTTVCYVVNSYFPAAKRVAIESGYAIATDVAGDRLRDRCALVPALPLPKLPSGVDSILHLAPNR